MSSAMELVIFFVLGLMAFGVGGIWLLVALSRSSKANARTRDDLLGRTDDVLDGVFDGRPMVTYQSTTRTLPLGVVVEGAGARGYVLLSNTEMPYGDLIEGRDLVFSRQESATS